MIHQMNSLNSMFPLSPIPYIHIPMAHCHMSHIWLILLYYFLLLFAGMNHILYPHPRRWGSDLFSTFYLGGGGATICSQFLNWVISPLSFFKSLYNPRNQNNFIVELILKFQLFMGEYRFRGSGWWKCMWCVYILT